MPGAAPKKKHRYPLETSFSTKSTPLTRSDIAFPARLEAHRTPTLSGVTKSASFIILRHSASVCAATIPAASAVTISLGLPSVTNSSRMFRVSVIERLSTCTPRISTRLRCDDDIFVVNSCACGPSTDRTPLLALRWLHLRTARPVPFELFQALLPSSPFRFWRAGAPCECPLCEQPKPFP